MKVSLVMAVYNGEEFLKEAINSILEQTYRDIEIIIVDDCSTDSTVEILNEIKDERLRVIHLNSNKGAAYALNVGIDVAEGQWIAIHDADDISYPIRIEEQVAFVKENPDVVAVGSHIECIGKSEDLEDKSIEMIKLQNNKNSITTWRQIKELLFNGSTLTHGSIFMSKKAFLDAGGYNPQYKIAYDYDLYMRLAHLGPIVNVPKILYKYRITNNSLSNINLLQTSNEFLLSCSKYIKTYCFAQKRNRLSVIAFGSKQGCQIFKELFNKNEYINVKSIIDEYDAEKVKEAFFEYKKGRVDAFIILSNAQDEDKLIDFLKRRGFKHNRNFFTIWSAY